MDPFIQPAQITKARKKTKHIDQVISGRMNLYYFLYGKSGMFCNILNIRTIFSSIAYRDLINFSASFTCCNFHL